MKVQYINEGVFGSYKSKTTQEDKLKNLKKETLKILINDVVKKLPELLKERIGQKEYLDSILSRKSADSYSYNFSQMFLRLQDFLGVEVEGDTIYLQFLSKFVSANGYNSNGPISYRINVYSLDYYCSYLMAEALCKDLNEEFGPGIKFDFRFILSDDLKDRSCEEIHIDNRNKINKWSLETLQNSIKYPEFLIKYKDVYNNRSADEVYIKLLEKTYNPDNTKFNNIIGTPQISVENIADSINYENNAFQYILGLCQTYPNKMRFYINPNKDLNNIVEYCESLTGLALEDMLNNKLTIYMLDLTGNTLSSNAFLKIVQKLSDISNSHFYISTKTKEDNRRVLTPCDSVEKAMDILIDKSYGRKLSFAEIGLYKGALITHNEEFNNMIHRAARNGDSKFYYLHVVIRDI